VKRSLLPPAAALPLPLLVITVATAPWLLWWHDLPPDLATQWNLLGQATTTNTRATALAFSTGLATLLALASLTYATWRNTHLPNPATITDSEGDGDGDAGLRLSGPTTSGTPPQAATADLWLGGLGFVGGILAGMSAATVWANRGATSWQAADLGLWWIAFVLPPGIAGARLGLRLERRLAPAPLPSTVPDERIELSDGELVTWSGTAEANPAIRGGPLLLFMTLGLWLRDDHTMALVGVGFLLVFLASVRVSVGAHGLRVRPEGLRWPSVHLPLDRIARAEAVDLRPLRWGGWGYRGSLRLFHRAAWIVRAGPALQVELTDGTTFATTVDHPTEAAAILNGLLSHRADPT
jgi:hypothetical protein